MPIGDLAVHEPDYKRLIAFLKAMEFNSLMRRVGGIRRHRRRRDRAGCEVCWARCRRPTLSPRRRGAARPANAAERRVRALQHCRSAALPPPAAGMTPRQRERRASGEFHAHAAGARRARGRSRAAAEIRPLANTKPCAALDRLNAWIARARDAGVVAIDTADHEPRSDAGGAVRLFARAGAERSLLRAARPPAGRRRRRWRTVPAASVAPDQIAEARRARRAQAAAGPIRACSRSGRT